MTLRDPAALEREILRFDPALPIESAWTPPASWYVAPDFAELEREAVFARSWQPVARAAELAEPGDFASGCFAGEPWVVARGADGALRGFHNVCRHKGREVVQGSGRADELVCGYHAWRYGLDGALVAAPRMGGAREFDRASIGLVPLRVESFGPWVFVNADPEARPLGERVAELDARLAASGWERLVFVERASWTLECNWKVYVDNYLDGGYHIPAMHPTLDAQLDMKSYRTELFDELSIQSSLPAPEPDERIAYDARRRIGERALYAWIFPNLMLNRYGPCLDSNHVVPLGPNRCRIDYEFYFQDPGDPAGAEEARRFVRESIEQSAVTQREDVAICESVQVGLRSRAYDRGRYAPKVELGEHHFHRLLAERYRRALGAGGASRP